MSANIAKQVGRARFIGKSFFKYTLSAALFIILITYIAERDIHMGTMERTFVRSDSVWSNYGLSDPETKIVYVKETGLFGWFLEVGVYPELNGRVKKEFRSRGYPYSEWYVYYVQAEKSYYPDYNDAIRCYN